MFRNSIKLSLLVVLCATFTLAQSTALVPSAERLREHVTYLASDKLEGRRTGSQGAIEAARYLSAEFKRLGLKPGPREVSLSRAPGAAAYYDSYLQPFPYIAAVELGRSNIFSFTSVANDSSKARPLKKDVVERLMVGEDWLPLGMSSPGRLEKVEAIWVGYGITAVELNHDDYAHKQVAGKVAIALAGSPDGDNPHGQFARYEGIRWKAIAARNAGAKALIVISAQHNLKDSPTYRLRYDNSAGDAGLPVVVVSRTAGERLLTANSQSLAAVEERLKSKQTNVNQEQSPTLPAQTALISLSIDLVRREGFAANVIGILEGSDPVLKNEVIVLGAHYDHLGYGGEGSLGPKEGDIHHGADDNASGTAGLLELARLFGAQKPRRTIIFIAFSGEEEGLLGSNYYVNHPVLPLTNTVAMVNMDMIGRMKNQKLVIGGVGTAQEWRSTIESANLMQSLTVSAAGAESSSSTHNLPIVVSTSGRTIVSSDPSKQFQLTLNDDGFGPSDHSSFYAKRIPVLFFWTGTHEDYHKPSDTADKINYEGQSRIIGLVARIVSHVDAADRRPTYTVARNAVAPRSTGFRVYLGTIPNYADSNDGLLLDGVREGSPAAMTGLKAGDKIVMLAGREVHNVYDYTYALGEMKAGHQYEIVVLREGERLTLKIIPDARR